MEAPPSTFRFSVRSLFIGTSLAGIGLAALKCPTPLVDELLSLATAILYASAIAIAFLTTGSRRTFWATFSILAVFLAWFPGSWFEGPAMRHVFLGPLWALFGHDPASFNNRLALPAPLAPLLSGGHEIAATVPDPGEFQRIFSRFFVVLVSTAAAHLLPWLIQRNRRLK